MTLSCTIDESVRNDKDVTVNIEMNNVDLNEDNNHDNHNNHDNNSIPTVPNWVHKQVKSWGEPLMVDEWQTQDNGKHRVAHGWQVSP